MRPCATTAGGRRRTSSAPTTPSAIRATTKKERIEPRVLDLAYRVQVHFQAKALRVVSAYRRGVSKHGKGRAIDIVVPGARDDEVARFARSLRVRRRGALPAQRLRALGHPPAQLLLGGLQRSRAKEPHVAGVRQGRRRGGRAGARTRRDAAHRSPAKNQTVSDDVDEVAIRNAEASRAKGQGKRAR